MSEWRDTTLANVATSIRNGVFAGRPLEEPTGQRILRISAVRDGRVDLADSRFVTGLAADQVERFSLISGDILMTRYNGSRHLVGIPGIVPDHDLPVVHPDKLIRVVVDREQADSRFINYQLQSPEVRSFLETRIRTTAGQSGISGGDVKEIPLGIPPLDEQRRIVALLDDHLSRLDAASELIRRSQQRLEIMDRAVVDDVMIRRADELEWPVIPLGELAGNKRAMTDGPFGSHLTTAHYSEVGARVVRLQNIADGQFKEADAFIELDHYALLEKHNVLEGDVVIASLGDLLPRAAVVPNLEGPAIVKADCIRVRLPKDVEAEWVVLACRSTRAKNWAKDRLHGVGRQRLGLGGIREIPIPMPESSVSMSSMLAWMADQLDNSHTLRTSLEKELVRGANLRRSLLEAAFSGRFASK